MTFFSGSILLPGGWVIRSVNNESAHQGCKGHAWKRCAQLGQVQVGRTEVVACA